MEYYRIRPEFLSYWGCDAGENDILTREDVESNAEVWNENVDELIRDQLKPVSEEEVEKIYSLLASPSIDRDDAILVAGKDAVKKAENEDAEPTNRVGAQGWGYDDGCKEYCSATSFRDCDGETRSLLVFYLISLDDQIQANTEEDYDWTPDHYQVI